MEYVTSIYALNVPCKLHTNTDLHFHALNWNNYTYLESTHNPLKDYGLEKKKIDLGNDVQEYIFANHIRAFFDCILLNQSEYISDFKFNCLIDDEYDVEIMNIACYLMENHTNVYKDLDCIIHRMFGRKWKVFKEEKYGVLDQQ